MTKLVEQLRSMSGPIRPNVVSTAADFIAMMQWREFATEKPENYSRVIVHRVIGDKSYVDVMNYIEEPASGMKPLVDTQHVKHWMPMPKEPDKGI
jgi:hypothetical protein